MHFPSTRPAHERPAWKVSLSCCANCHHMCHRSHLGTSWRTPDTLRQVLANDVPAGDSP